MNKTNKTGFIFFALYLSVINSAISHTTVTAKFEITNKDIKEDIESNDKTMRYTKSGVGLYKIQDNYTDINDLNLRIPGNHQVGHKRYGSTFLITMKGINLGHSFNVLGKYANSEFKILASHTNQYAHVDSNNGCLNVSPNRSNYKTNFKITSDDNIKSDCIGSSVDVGFDPGVNPLKPQGINREVYIDIGSLLSNPDYKNAPPDIYIGTQTYNKEHIKNRVGEGYRPLYTTNITIKKNPYFDSISLPNTVNNFDIKSLGNNIIGNVTIPYVINGQFTPYNRITLNITSNNNFSLINNNNNNIPYSLSTTIGTRKINLVNNGQPQNSGVIELTDLPKETHAIQARFDANFSTNKDASKQGTYTDNLVAIFQISL